MISSSVGDSFDRKVGLLKMGGLDGVPGVEKHLPTVLECRFHQSETAETLPEADGCSARSFSDKLLFLVVFFIFYFILS